MSQIVHQVVAAVVVVVALLDAMAHVPQIVGTRVGGMPHGNLQVALALLVKVPV